MKRSVFNILVVQTLTVLILAGADAGAQPPVRNVEPEQIPSMSAIPGDQPGEILKAEQFNLDDYAGKVVLVDFWASWCKPCRKSMPWLSQMQAKYQPEGLVVIAVNLDRDLASAGLLLTDLDPRIIVVHDPDGAVAGKFELEGMPSSYVFDRAGKLRASHTGFTMEEAAARDRELYEVLTEKGAKAKP